MIPCHGIQHILVGVPIVVPNIFEQLRQMIMATFSSFVALSMLGLSHAGDFVETAELLYNSKDELVELYKSHKLAHAKNQESELDVLLSDMHQYVVDNENVKAPKNVLTIMTDDMGWVRN